MKHRAKNPIQKILSIILRSGNLRNWTKKTSFQLEQHNGFQSPLQIKVASMRYFKH